MANEHTAFWLALLTLGRDRDQRTRLWNGYLGWKLPLQINEEGEPLRGWPQLILDPPDGDWPELTQEEYEILESVAKEHGGYPEFDKPRSMDFSGHTFSDYVDLSGLTLLHSNFANARFEGPLMSGGNTRFYGPCLFQEARFEEGVSCALARFNAPVSFERARFKKGAYFLGVKFKSGASFTNVVFEEDISFDNSKFEDNFGPETLSPEIFFPGTFLQRATDFTNAKFMGKTSFSGVLFGNDDRADSQGLRPKPRTDFSGAKFLAPTSFRSGFQRRTRVLQYHASRRHGLRPHRLGKG